MKFEELAGRNVVVWGAGREGRSALAELERRGIDAAVAVTGDGQVPGDLTSVGVSGEEAMARLRLADAIVKSPGIPHTSPEFVELRDGGARFTSLMDLWLHEHQDRVIAVTGTKGKSTTSTLIQHILAALGVGASLAGNVGIAVGGELGENIRAAVTEVSSYQAAELTVSPRIAVLTSLYPEHLPWHGGYEQYVADKLNLIGHGPEAVVIPSRDSELGERVMGALDAGPGQTRVITPADLGIEITATHLTWAGVGRLALDEIALRGSHNLGNVALALATATAFTPLSEPQKLAALESLRSFAPLEHRLEQVPSSDGAIWVDDSLATAPQAVVAALQSYEDSAVVLIAGGAERDLSFEPLIAYLADRAQRSELPVRVVGTGPAGHRLLTEAEGRAPGLHSVASFAEATDLARRLAAEGEVVLLSPGAPSFDEFADYEARAAAFRNAAGGAIENL